MQYLFGPPTPYKYTIYYQESYSSRIETVRCLSVEDLDESISGIEMDKGYVLKVEDFTGKQVTSEEIGSHQTESF